MTNWYLAVTTWTEVLGYAKHFYGRLRRGDEYPGRGIEVEHAMSAAEAADLSEHDDYLYHAGDTTTQFFSQADLERAAIDTWNLHAEAGDVLFEGDSAYLDPQRVLAGPEEFVTAANALYDEAEACGWWDGDETRMKDICIRWDALMGRKAS